MRILRLFRQFDAVFVHDAMRCLTSEEDPAPGHAHGLRPLATGRGSALFAPDHVRQNVGGLASKPEVP
jgi:hypothetical protein